MNAVGLLMPIVAAGSLTIALLVPLRDARRGERATLSGRMPIRSLLGTTEHQGVRSTRGSYVARLRRAIDTMRATFVAVLALRPRAMNSIATDNERVDADESTTSGDSFADRLASLVSDPAPSDGQSPPIEHESDVSEGDRSDLDGRPLATSMPDSKHTQAPQERTLLARDVPPPLTRLRLRPDSGAITWPKHLPMPHLGMGDGERRTILADLQRAADFSHERALTCAYREEDAIGRAMALRGLARVSTHGSQAVLADALKFGSDDERALAVDLLSRSDDRESLVPALNDRLDAIAARAALAYVGSNRRSDYENLLSPHVDERRLASILSLLGGILE
jgi:hypothetical protein